MTDELVSRPETVIRLRETRKRLNLTVTQVCSMVHEMGDPIAETTVRRFLNEKESPTTKYSQITIDTISEVLLGPKNDNFDETKCRVYFQEATELRASSEIMARELAETKAQLDHYRELWEWQKAEIEFLKETIRFLEGRLEYISPEKRTGGQ